ncbi:MAG: DUF2505 family protein [Acidimicrobiia bacterium]|nr:DUF2505 family protein [Acidimicrobiia bacterium]
MDFEIIQDISATVDAVDRTLIDPGFLVLMAELPKLGAATVLDQRRDDDLMVQDVRYLFQAELSRAVTRVVDPKLLTWVERSTCNLTTHVTECEIRPDHYDGLLAGGYRSTIVGGPTATRRTLTGEIKVRMPLVGGKVERAIIGGLEENAMAQIGLIETWLTGAAEATETE